MDNQNKPTNETPQSATTVESRRKFIQKASLGGATLTTLSAQSVWGVCTVSGALSSGSNVQVDDCQWPNITGRSTGVLGQFGSISNGDCGCNDDKNDKATKGAFYDFLGLDKDDVNKNQRKCIVSKYCNLLNSSVTLKGTALDQTATFSFNIKDKLCSGGHDIYRFYAGKYINAYYGVYTLDVGTSSTYGKAYADALIQHLHAISLYYLSQGSTIEYIKGTLWDNWDGADKSVAASNVSALHADLISQCS